MAVEPAGRGRPRVPFARPPQVDLPRQERGWRGVSSYVCPARVPQVLGALRGPALAWSLVSGSSVIRGLPGSARARVAGSRLVHLLLHWSQV